MTEERKYIRLPSRDWWQSLVRFLLFVANCLLVFGGLKLMVGFWHDFNLGFATNDKYSLNLIVLFPWFAIEYCLIGLSAVCFCAWIKKGYKNLKQFNSNHNGIISLVVYGLGSELFALLCFFGIAIAVQGLVVGLFGILILLLSVLLIGVLVIGLILEFRVCGDEVNA